MRKKHYGMFCITLLIMLLMFSFSGCPNTGKPVRSSFHIKDQVIKESTKFLELDLEVPILSGFDSAETINREISDSVAKARTEVEEAASLMERGDSGVKAGLYINYLYSKSGNIVSLWLMLENYEGGAHGLYWVEPYTFNLATNEIYHFSDLFREGKASAALVTEKVVNKIKSNPEMYFASAPETVKNYKNELPYYINGNRIVVFFPLYDIAPYAGGIQFFDFKAEELRNILKPEIYEAIKKAEPADTKGTILEH